MARFSTARYGLVLSVQEKEEDALNPTKKKAVITGQIVCQNAVYVKILEIQAGKRIKKPMVKVETTTMDSEPEILWLAVNDAINFIVTLDVK